MTVILFTVFARKTCSAVSPLPEDFYANFGGDLIPDDSQHSQANALPEQLFLNKFNSR